MKQQKNLKESKKKFDNYIRYSSLAFEMAAIMAIGVFAGFKIDGWLNLSFPVFTLALMIFSVVAAIYHAIKNFLK
jgi:predicted membrane channel-forming protein YqfA (hemolysin III family)